MKKITALLVILALFVAMLSACGDNKETQTDNGGEKTPVESQQPQDDTNKDDSDTASPEESALSVAENFMSAYAKLDFVSASQYVDDPSVFENPLLAMVSDPTVLMETILDASGLIAEEFPYSSYFAPTFTAVVDKLKANVSFDKIASDLVDGNYEVSYKLTSPDTASFDDAFALLGNAFTEDAFAEKAIELVESGVLSVNATEDEATEMVCKAIADDFANIVSSVELQFATTEVELLVKNIDGKWLVSSETFGM